MTLYCITYKDNPVSLNKLLMLNGCSIERTGKGTKPIVAFSVKACKDEYLYHFGFTWRERPKGIAISRLEVPHYLSPF